jgi:hypothetical protein
MKLSNAKVLTTLAKSNLKDDELRVAVTILAHRNESKLLCIPSQDTLAKLSLKKQPHISRLVKRLKNKGVLETIRTINHNNQLKAPTQYAFLCDFLDAINHLQSPDYDGTPETKDDFMCIREKLNGKANLTLKNQPNCI